MTLNDSWGYHAADFNWKSPTTVIRNLITCARDGGNYLLNIGPRGDGTIPEESVRILTTVGDWMSKKRRDYSANPIRVSRAAETI
jgi:alpha-L-fucosidase